MTDATLPINLYRPSNGTEGECFYENWCYNCARDKPMSEGKDYDTCADNEVCSIIGDTLAYDIDDPRYPQAWCYDVDGNPQCTSFVQAGHPVPLRDDRTLDLFEIGAKAK